MDHLSIAVQDRIATITFDNPPLSVMTPQTIQELSDLLPSLESNEIGAVVVTGASDEYFIRHFSVETLNSSAHETEPARNSGQDRTKRPSPNMVDVLLRLESLQKPVITALNGTALGGGLEFALATDIRVAKDGPYRFGLPEISVGILPGGGGTQRLSALIGRNRALNMMWRAKLLTPAEALDVGIIDELVPQSAPESALERARCIAADIAARPPLAVAHIKRLTKASTNPVTKDLLAMESRLFAELMKTDDAKRLLAEVAALHKTERKEKGG